MNHVYERHTSCERMHCPICDGGLAVCTVCLGAEGSLPTHCPGAPMSADRQEEVYAGALDFVAGKWRAA